MPASSADRAALLDRLERYYDAVPRSSARTEEIGPFTLFVASGGWPYYARPRVGGAGPFTPESIEAVRTRQRELGVPEAFEWVHETTPALLAPMRGTGLTVHEYPLMVLGAPMTASAPALVRVRLLDADDPALPAAQAVAEVGFGHPGTSAGEAGAAARDAAAHASPVVEHVRDRMRRGIAVMAVAEDDTGPLAVGTSQPVESVTEIVGVATLPAARRRGLGAAVTAALVEDAHKRGVDLVFLSAGGDDVARVYGRVGFTRVGTACIAEPTG
jgi:ribosomal protein S18 acetylase RimI-like enzyme